MNRHEDRAICEALGWSAIREHEGDEWGMPPTWAIGAMPPSRGHAPFFALPTWTLFDCAAVAALLPIWTSPLMADGRVRGWHVRLMSPHLLVERSGSTLGAALKSVLLRAATLNPTALRALLP